MVPRGFSGPLNDMINLCIKRDGFKSSEMKMIQNGLTNFTVSEMVLALEHKVYELLYWNRAEQYLKEGVHGAAYIMNIARHHQHTIDPTPRPSKKNTDQAKHETDQSNTPNNKTQTGNTGKLMEWAQLHHEPQAKTKKAAPKPKPGCILSLS